MITAFTKLFAELNDSRERISEALIKGSAKDYAHYRELCGEIRGLSLAQQLLTDFVREMEHNDE